MGKFIELPTLRKHTEQRVKRMTFMAGQDLVDMIGFSRPVVPIALPTETACQSPTGVNQDRKITFSILQTPAIYVPPASLRTMDFPRVFFGAFSSSFEGSGDSCSECPVGSYRSVEDDGACLACPPNSTTLQRGRWLKNQCVCARNFYDGQVRRLGPKRFGLCTSSLSAFFSRTL